MAIEKRFAFNQPPNKSFGTSITIQSPTTSANQSNHDDVIDPNNNTSSNNNTNNLLNDCHLQAATRSLLIEAPPEMVATTTNSDESPTPPPHYHEIPGIVPAYQGRTSGPPPSYDDVVNPNAPPPSYQTLFGQAREARKTSNGLVDLFRQLFLILIGTLGCTMIIGFLLLIPITMILVGIVYVNECRAENIPAFLVIGGFVWIIKNILNCYNQFKKDSSIANRPPPRRAPISSANTSTTNRNIPIANVLSVNQNRVQGSSLIAIQSQTGLNQTTLPQTEYASTTRTTRLSSRDQQIINRIRHPTLIGITSYKCETMLNYFLIVWFLTGCIVVYRIYEPDYDNPSSTSYCNRTVYLYAFWLMTSAFIIMAIVLSCLCCLMASSLISCNHGR